MDGVFIQTHQQFHDVVQNHVSWSQGTFCGRTTLLTFDTAS